MLANRLVISQVSLFLPIKSICVISLRTSMLVICQIHQVTWHIFMQSLKVSVNTELSLQIQTFDDMECQGCITEYFCIIVHILVSLQDMNRVRHSLKVHRHAFRSISRSILSIVLNRHPRNHLDHSTTSVLSTAILRSRITPSVVYC